VLSRARVRLHEEFSIEHATLQVEPAQADGACQPVSW
jgi:cobalt-zinc-cadmium efflux system protein